MPAPSPACGTGRPRNAADSTAGVIHNRFTPSLASPRAPSVPDLNKPGEEFKGHGAERHAKDSFLPQRQDCIREHFSLALRGRHPWEVPPKSKPARQHDCLSATNMLGTYFVPAKGQDSPGQVQHQPGLRTDCSPEQEDRLCSLLSQQKCLGGKK